MAALLFGINVIANSKTVVMKENTNTVSKHISTPLVKATCNPCHDCSPPPLATVSDMKKNFGKAVAKKSGSNISNLSNNGIISTSASCDVPIPLVSTTSAYINKESDAAGVNVNCPTGIEAKANGWNNPQNISVVAAPTYMAFDPYIINQGCYKNSTGNTYTKGAEVPLPNVSTVVTTTASVNKNIPGATTNVTVIPPNVDYNMTT